MALRPLQRGMKKPVFESWLKSARRGVADSKSGTDFKLRCATDFHVHSPAFLECRAHGVQSERGRVAIAAEMPEHNAVDSAR